jgi:hypothetical protein
VPLMLRSAVNLCNFVHDCILSLDIPHPTTVDIVCKFRVRVAFSGDRENSLSDHLQKTGDGLFHGVLAPIASAYRSII